MVLGDRFHKGFKVRLVRCVGAEQAPPMYRVGEEGSAERREATVLSCNVVCVSQGSSSFLTAC